MITKHSSFDSIAFSGFYKILEVRELTEYIETIDGEQTILSQTYDRKTYQPDQLNPRLLGTDDEGNEYYTEPLPEIFVPYVTGVWTDELVNAYIENIENS